MSDQTSDPTLAPEICCKLITACRAGDEAVEWSDVQDALNVVFKVVDPL